MQFSPSPFSPETTRSLVSHTIVHETHNISECRSNDAHNQDTGPIPCAMMGGSLQMRLVQYLAHFFVSANVLYLHDSRSGVSIGCMKRVEAKCAVTYIKP